MYLISKRLFDIFFSLVLLIALLPLFLGIMVILLVFSKFPVFFCQQRCGLNGTMFTIIKFRTMVTQSPNNSFYSLGTIDSRITPVGRWLRKYKLDELPQLYNILKGDMTFVGPRPRVPKFWTLFPQYKEKILSVKPGCTDYATLKYFNEAILLNNARNPESLYIQIISPDKIQLHLRYIEEQSIYTDIKILIRTIACFFRVM